jgi:hypothetical protein
MTSQNATKLFPPEGFQYRKGTEDFYNDFSQYWEKLKKKFLKFERRRSYLEPDNPSFVALQEGRLDEVVPLLRDNLYQQKPFFESAAEKGIKIIRCRIVEIPLSEYLKWEFESYTISSELGEQIYCVLADDVADILNKYKPEDFLLFDKDVALLHDYSAEGLLVGSWRIDKKGLLNEYIDLYDALMEKSLTFQDFNKKYA